MGPAPAIALHLYEFKAVGETHNGTDYWWDLFIKDDTTNSAWIRGGGTEFANSAQGCCSSAAEWGGEGQGDGGYTYLPATNGDQLYYKPTGNANYYLWGGSNAYPIGGQTTCQADDAVSSSDGFNCPFAGGLDGGTQSGYWNTKYNNWTYRLLNH